MLDLRHSHRLNAGDVAIDLIEGQSIERKKRDAADEALARLQRASEVADQHRFPRSELDVGDRLVHEFFQLVDDEARNFGCRFVFRLRAGDERSDIAAQIERASRAVTESALDPNLLI